MNLVKVFAGVVFVLTCCVSSRAGIISVPGDQPTIQAGIDAAAAGDTVLVASGTYTGNGNRDIVFNGKEITVESETGAETCIIDCTGSEPDNHRGFTFTNGETQNSILTGFTIMNGYMSGYGDDCNGGGIYIKSSSPVVSNCIVSSNYARVSGGGIEVDLFGTECDPIIHDCVITNNTSDHWGGGIYCAFGSIRSCEITGNWSDTGGGLDCGFGDISVVNCLINGNTAGSLRRWNGPGGQPGDYE